MTTTTAPCSMATQSGTTRAPPCATSTRASTRTRSTRSSGDAGGSFRGASLSASALLRAAGPCAATGHGARMLPAQAVLIGRRRAGLTRAIGAAPSPPGRARITAPCDPHALSFPRSSCFRSCWEGQAGLLVARSGAGRIAALVFSYCFLVNVCVRTIRGATSVHMLNVCHVFPLSISPPTTTCTRTPRHRRARLPMGFLATRELAAPRQRSCQIPARACAVRVSSLCLLATSQ